LIGLTDAVVIITGGSSGIGRACAQKFASEGAFVVLAARRRSVGVEAAAAIGERATFVPCDVSVEGDVKSLISDVLKRFGHVDCVINNAGAGSATSDITETDSADFDHDIAVHVRAPFLAMKYAAPSMMNLRRGSFINISSVSATRAGFNRFGYEVAKAALVHLTRCAALEFGESGVRANSISPGPVLTEIFTRLLGDAAHGADRGLGRIETAFNEILRGVQPLPGMMHPEEIANAALFLASDQARYINGHDLTVDGGICAGRPASSRRTAWQALSNAVRTPA